MRGRLLLLPLAFLLAAFAVVLVATGGFVIIVAGLRVSARSPWPAVVGSVASAGWWWLLARRAGAIERDSSAAAAWVEARSLAILLVVAMTGAALAVRYGTFAASGSDPSGYLSEAALLADGALSRVDPLAAIADWPGGAATLSPLGWRPDGVAGEQVPTYAIGLPLLMAPLHAIGGTLAAALVVPLALAVLVLATGLVARQLGGPFAGILAASWMMSSPIALFQAAQPMSDVPMAAAWLAGWALLLEDVPPGGDRRRAVFVVAAAAAAAIAVMIRPNLAVLAVVPALFLLCGDRRAPWPIRRQRALVFSACAAAGVATVAFFQWQMYGSPLRSGYGRVSDLYDVQFIAGNVLRYPRWLIETHGAWLLLALAGVVWPRAAKGRARWLMAFAALNYAAYLPFAQFETWDYLRFILPAVAILGAVAAAVAVSLLSSLPRAAFAPALALVLIAIAGFGIREAAARGVFELRDLHARYRVAGRFLADRLPIEGVVVAGEHSGSARYYSARSVLRWDVMPDGGVVTAIGRLTRAGHDVWIVLDEWEEERFRRAAGSAALDWPPAMEAGLAVRTRAWRLADRARYAAGERVWTDSLR